MLVEIAQRLPATLELALAAAAIAVAVGLPLGVVSANGNLANWPGNTVFSAALMLAAALQNGSVTIEYYKFNGRLLLAACASWTKHDEP